MSKPQILITNDDGIHEPGLKFLVDALVGLGDLHIYAPQTQQSAVGHGMSLHRPLRVQNLQGNWFMVDGTPTDCIMLAARDLMGVKPDLVVSGINPGANLGDDVTYSGTVAGAYEGMLMGFPAIAVSCVSYVPRFFETSAAVARQVAEWALKEGMPNDTMLNVNVPDVPLAEIRGVQTTRMGKRHYEDEIVHRTDPRGILYYWIGGATPGHHLEPGTDFQAIEDTCVSITPLRRDVTAHDALGAIASVTGVLDTLEAFPKP